MIWGYVHVLLFLLGFILGWCAFGIYSNAKMKSDHKLTSVEFRKLLKDADRARERVSGYSDEQRVELEAHARAKIYQRPAQ